MGAGAAAVAAVHPAVSAIGALNSSREERGTLGTVTQIGSNSFTLKHRHSDATFQVDAAKEIARGFPMPEVGQTVSVLGPVAGGAIRAESFVVVSELLRDVMTSDLTSSSRFRMSRSTRRMQYSGDQIELATEADLQAATTDALVVRRGDGRFDVLAVGRHTGEE